MCGSPTPLKLDSPNGLHTIGFGENIMGVMSVITRSTGPIDDLSVDLVALGLGWSGN
jgi:hypothetical protein